MTRNTELHLRRLAKLRQEGRVLLAVCDSLKPEEPTVAAEVKLLAAKCMVMNALYHIRTRCEELHVDYKLLQTIFLVEETDEQDRSFEITDKPLPGEPTAITSEIERLLIRARNQMLEVSYSLVEGAESLAAMAIKGIGLRSN